MIQEKQIILSAIVISLLISCTQAQETRFKPIIHQYHDPQVGFLNAFLVETENGAVAIDAGFLTYQAAALRAMVDSLQRPLRAILLTHGHADHYNGATILRGSDDAAIVATAGIDKQIRERDALYESRFKPEVNELYPMNRTFPTKIVADGETLTFDSVSFTVHDLGPGESQDDVYWEVKCGDETHAFIGDLVLNRVHAFFQSGHSSDWVASLEELKKIIPGNAKVYPGHGEIGPRRCWTGRLTISKSTERK